MAALAKIVLLSIKPPGRKMNARARNDFHSLSLSRHLRCNPRATLKRSRSEKRIAGQQKKKVHFGVKISVRGFCARRNCAGREKLREENVSAELSTAAARRSQYPPRIIS
jgi:hypothetical protein